MSSDNKPFSMPNPEVLAAQAVASAAQRFSKHPENLLKGKRFAVLGDDVLSKQVAAKVQELGGEVVPEDTPNAIVLANSGSQIPGEPYSFELITHIYTLGELPDFETFRIRKTPALPANLQINASPLTKSADEICQEVEGASTASGGSTGFTGSATATSSGLPPNPESNDGSKADTVAGAAGAVAAGAGAAAADGADSAGAGGVDTAANGLPSETRHYKRHANYGLPPPPPSAKTVARAATRAGLPKKRSTKFTEQEDEAILDLIRRNPYLRSTHSFYAQIARIPLLSNHTGNSIRFRYRKALSKNINWVYAVDPATNELQHDENGNLIRTTELPGLLKSQYTADEDYDLCRHILDFRHQDNPSITRKRKMDTNSIPEHIFQTLAQEHPRHSAMSWRDRYRKFASVYGLERYIKYYRDCQDQGKAPQPMRNLSSRNAGKRRKIEATVTEDEATPKPKQETGENGTPLDELQALARESVAKAAADEVDADEAEDDDDDDKDNAGDEESKREHRVQPAEAAENGKANKDSAEDAVASAASADSSEQQSANLFEDVDEMRALNLDFATSITPHSPHGGSPFLGSVSLDALKKSEPKPLPSRENANAGEITKEIEDVLGEFGSDIKSSEDLFKAIHRRTGLSSAWLSHWFDCAQGVPNAFLGAVQNYLGTGELVPQSQPGFWTEEHDQMLRDGEDLAKLIKLHGEESVSKRRASVLGADGE